MTDQDPLRPIEPTTPTAPEQPAAPSAGQPAAEVAPPASPYAPPISPYAPPAAGGAPSPQTPVWSMPPANPLSPLPAGVAVPVSPVASPRKRQSPVRWVVALLVVALVVAGGLGATLLLTGSSGGASDLANYVPQDSLMYAEGRLDLPGSQRAEVAKALSGFPGFADQASLEAKIGEVFDRIVRAATSSKHDYQTEIAPWFGGQIAYSSGPADPLSMVGGLVSPPPSTATSPTAALPPCTGGDTATPTPAPSATDELGGSYPASSPSIRVLALASVKDPAKAGAWVSSVLGDAVTTSDRTCDGVTVHIVSRQDGVGFRAPDMGWAILDNKVLVGGDLDSIRLAIATKGTAGLAATPTFQKAVGSLSGDHVGMVFEAVRATFGAQASALERLDTEGTMSAAYRLLVSLVPEWIVGDLRAADGNFVSSMAEPATDLQPTTNRPSDLAGLAPAGTIALMDVHDLGKMLGTIHAKFAGEPKFDAYVKQLDTALGLLGGFDSTLGWIGDAGFAVTRNGTSVSGGILIRPDDSSAAKHLFTQIRSLADLSGASSGVAISDETYNGATLTTVDLASLAPALQSQLGAGAGGMTVPSDLKLVYAVTDKVVVLTLDTAFAKAVIDASQGGDSLAKSPRFSALLAKAGDKVTSLSWLDVTAIRELIENALPADAKAKYESDIKPYLLPFDAMVSNASADNGLLRSNTILSINH